MTTTDNETRRRDESGFTLIELLIVIVVLAILAAVVIFALGGVTGQSAVSACNSDVKTVETAVQAFQTQTGALPTQTSDLVPSYIKTWPSNGTHYTVAVDWANGNVWVAPNVSALTAADTFTATASDTWAPYDSYTSTTTNGNICTLVH